MVAVNDLTATPTLAHLLSYDSTFGRLGVEAVAAEDGSAIQVGESHFAVTAERDPAALDWGAYGVDIVIESTGRFRTRDAAAVHLKSGPRKDRHDVISNASCTTNCLAPWPTCCTSHSAWSAV